MPLLVLPLSQWLCVTSSCYLLSRCFLWPSLLPGERVKLPPFVLTNLSYSFSRIRYCCTRMSPFFQKLDFHLNQPLLLPTPFSEPTNDTEHMLHILDVGRALAFYVSRTKDFRSSNRLFVCYFGKKKGLPASPSTLSRWLVSTISLAYELQHKTPPEGLWAHSTRAISSSTALLRGVDVPDICRTSTWSNAVVLNLFESNAPLSH